MDDGYARFRRLNDEANRDARRLQREAVEKLRDRSDAERRHRELVAAARASRPSARDDYQRGSSSDAISLKTVLILFSGALLVFAVSMALGPDREAGSTLDVHAAPQRLDEGNTPIGSDAQLEMPGETLSSEQEVPPRTATEAANTNPTINLEELRGPILRSLDTGERVQWKVDEAAGYVVVSALVQTANGRCRTALIGSATKGAPETSSVWCRKGSADWVQVKASGAQE